MSSGYSIAFIERSTGISRETLRMWERRYGFPTPERDASGDRSYAPLDLDRLRQIKRLLDLGYRPGKVVPLSLAELASLESSHDGKGSASDPGFETFLQLLRKPGATGARRWLSRRMREEPIARFTIGTLVPLTKAVGDAWASGRLCVHEEHMFSEMLARLLRQAMDGLPPGTGPVIVLTTLPEERHGLGLLMAETLLRAEGARCVSLGVDTPIPEIILAVIHHRADALALSFSAAYPRRRIVPQLEVLRAQLPAECQIWAGGGVTGNFRRRRGVRFCPELTQVATLLSALKLGERPDEIG